MRPTWLIAMLGALMAAGLPAISVGEGPPAAADTVGPYALVSVAGSSLSDVSAAPPYDLSPAFSSSTTDYVLRCNAGTNQVTLKLSAATGGISVGTNQQSSHVSGTSVVVTLSVTPNQAILVYAPDPSSQGSTPAQYWIRCLPPDFPPIQVNRAGPSSPGWTPGYYFTADVDTSPTPYAMVLDGNGTPVWYQALPPTAGGATNVEPLPDDTIAWSPNLGPGIGAGLNGNAYTGFDLRTQSTIDPLAAAVSPTDQHELWPLPNGDRLMISTPVITGVDLSTLGDGAVFFANTSAPASAADGNVVDCVVQEVNPSNQAVWSWRASQHIGLDEVNTSGNPGPPWNLQTLNGSPAADLYHCNSVSMDEDSSSPYFGDVLVSMRHLDAVLLIDPATGDVIWKMGGTPLTVGDPEDGQGTPAQYLAVSDDSEGGFCGQHDARFVATPDPAVEDVSVYDDHTDCPGAARGVELAVDATAGTATPDYQYPQPQGLSVPATGSFRRMPGAGNAIGSGTSLVGWGITSGDFLSGFTEVDSGGNVLCDIRFPDGGFLYRAVKVGASDVDLPLLRQTAGWTGTAIPPPPPGPVVTAVSPVSGPTGGGTSVTITGSGFTGASSVTFGGHPAAFSVPSAGTVVATSPADVGPGSVDIVVTAPGGRPPMWRPTNSPTPGHRRLSSWAWHRPMTVTATGWWHPTGACSPAATPAPTVRRATLP